jgi:hypothetical protein
MTAPRPLGNAARCHVVDAERSAREIRRLRERAANLAAIDRRGLEAVLWQIEAQAIIIELALTKARMGEELHELPP